MQKIFYDHLVMREEIVEELGRYKIDAVELDELIQLANETLHHHVLDVILTHLPKEKHEEFLTKFHQAPHDEKLLEYLRVETGIDIEGKIKERAQIAKKELLAEIKRSRK